MAETGPQGDSRCTAAGAGEDVSRSERELIGYVPGVFDMFHVGHLNILRRSAERCTRLVAGVVTDELVRETKGHLPIIPLDERLEIVRSISCVDEVFVDTSLDKRVAWQRVRFHMIFKGDDWRGTAKGKRLEKQVAEVGAEVVYLPYTVHTSSTMLRAALDRVVTNGSAAADSTLSNLGEGVA